MGFKKGDKVSFKEYDYQILGIKDNMAGQQGVVSHVEEISTCFQVFVLTAPKKGYWVPQAALAHE